MIDDRIKYRGDDFIGEVMAISGAAMSLAIISKVLISRGISGKNSRKAMEEFFDIDYDMIFYTPHVEPKDLTGVDSSLVKYRPFISKFLLSLESIASFDQTNMLNNLNTLRIRSINKPDDKRTYFGKKRVTQSLYGRYDAEDNIITAYSNEYDRYIGHELFHCASTTREDRKYYPGFRRNIYKDNGIGFAINEGFTESLNIDNYREDNKEDSYHFEVKQSRLLESILSTDRMTELYSRSDLEGLVSELEQYISRDKIIRYLKNMDFISLTWTSGNKVYLKKCRECLEEIDCFMEELGHNYSMMTNYNISEYHCINSTSTSVEGMIRKL